MNSSPTSKPMATVKFNCNPPSRPASRNHTTTVSRPASPLKSYVSVETSTFRPKAKINSSATTRKVASTASTDTPRAASPTKLTPRIRKGVVSPTQPYKASSTVGTISRSQTPVSAPVTPEIRNRSFTTSSGERIRADGTSLHHVASFSSFQPLAKSNVSITRRLAPSKSVVGLSDRDREGASSPVMRIRSKMTTMPKSQSESVTGTISPLPPHPSTRPASSHARSPSITSPPTSPPPIHQIYPITTAVPAANPHRFTQTRPPPTIRNPAPFQNNNNTFQSLSPSNDRPPPSRIGNVIAKVDPAFIPLPPHSPPTSALSFSSRSSVSHSSASHTAGSTDSRLSPVTRQAQNGNTEHLRSTLDNLVMYTSMNSGDDNYSGDSGHDRETDGEIGNNEDRKVKAEAKSNRKIADLEITNRSLLAINSSLEATKHRQSKEIRELRRKLRESRLILPPGAFRAVKSSLEPAENGDDEEDVDDNSEGEDVVEGSGDDIYKRIKLILDNLLQTGRKALETQVKDFPEGGKGGAKVLSPEELRDWHGSSNQHDDHELQSTREGDDGDEQLPNNALPEAELSFDDDTLMSEDEVEVITLPNTSPPPSPALPPILITQST